MIKSSKSTLIVIFCYIIIIAFLAIMKTIFNKTKGYEFYIKWVDFFKEDSSELNKIEQYNNEINFINVSKTPLKYSSNRIETISMETFEINLN